ncbi:MAG TPA: choice-of-anchor D domain-containing protein, partial [Bacteroidales bacterium]|nr:choice-of-anchor D domain-containing protein [Bacteroidales bacterium]
MKSLIFQLTSGLIVMLAGWTAVKGANTLLISSPSTGPTQGFTVSVEIRNSDPFTAFQFDLAIPAGFTYIPGTALLNPSRSNGHQLAADMLSDNILRIAGYSQNNLPFHDTIGTILTFRLNSGTEPGNYSLSLLSPVIGDSTGTNILTGFTNGTVTLLAPDLIIPDSILNFNRTPLGASAEQMLTLFNAGNQPLQIISMVLPSPWFSLTGAATFSIPAGQSREIGIRFTSQVKGTYNIPLTITCNDPDEGTREIALHAIAFAVNELHTGNIFCHSGSPAFLTFSVNNMESLTGFQFDLVLPAPVTYLPQSAVLTLRKTDHVVSASLVGVNRLRVVAHSPGRSNFTGNSGDIVTLSFNVRGTGGYYPLTLENVILGDSLGQNVLSDFYSGNLIIAAPDITGNPAIDFGNVPVTESASLAYPIRNVGSDTLKIDYITFTDPSFSLMTPLPVTLLPSTEGNVVIGFHRAVRGQVHGTMRIFSNDPDESPYMVRIDAFSYVPNCIVIPGLTARYVDTVSVPVNINNLEPVTGFQFDLGFPSCMSYIPGSATLTSRCADHLLQAESLSGTSIRCLAYSPVGTVLSGDT